MIPTRELTDGVKEFTLTLDTRTPILLINGGDRNGFGTVDVHHVELAPKWCQVFSLDPGEHYIYASYAIRVQMPSV